MMENEKEVLQVLLSIEDKLNRIYVCFENQYLEIQNQKNKEKIDLFNKLLSDKRKMIFQLIFDEKHLSQTEIAKKVGVSKQAVSAFIIQLVENDLIDQKIVSEKLIYIDKYNLLGVLEKQK